MQRYKPPVLIDEIQKAPELLPYIKLIVDEDNTMGSVWLTGSQPFHLMKQVSESLAGRVGIIELLGLSNAEISGVASEPYKPDQEYFMRRVEASKPLDVVEVYKRIFTGFLPGIRPLSDDIRTGAYESYLNTYIMRDIRDLAQVGDELKFRRFMAACAALTSRPVVYAELARLADIDEKTAKTWLSLLVSSYLVKLVEPYSNNLLKRLSKQPLMHFLDTGLAAYLSGWSSAEALEIGAMSGQVFETYAFGEVYKSFTNAGRRAPLYFFRTNDKKEIDILMEQDGILYPIEVKKSASPSKNDTRNMGAIDPVAAADVPGELIALKRQIGTGAILCLANDTFPINSKAWAFPVWAV
jgi:predicted AAA+ superfamily ATPase